MYMYMCVRASVSVCATVFGILYESILSDWYYQLSIYYACNRFYREISVC